MWVWRWVDGTKQGWSSPGKPVYSFTARPPSQPGIAPPPEFPKAFQPAAPPQDKEKAEDKDNTLGGTHQGGSGFAVLLVLGQFWPQLWRAFPTSQSRLLTCSCCCSSPSAPDQRPVTTKASLASLLTRSCSSSHDVSSNWSLPGRPGWQTGKQWGWRKGKPPRKMAVCFQLASRQGREGHVHQSIEDQGPIRVRV